MNKLAKKFFALTVAFGFGLAVVGCGSSSPTKATKKDEPTKPEATKAPETKPAPTKAPETKPAPTKAPETKPAPTK